MLYEDEQFWVEMTKVAQETGLEKSAILGAVMPFVSFAAPMLARQYLTKPPKPFKPGGFMAGAQQKLNDWKLSTNHTASNPLKGMMFDQAAGTGLQMATDKIMYPSQPQQPQQQALQPYGNYY